MTCMRARMNLNFGLLEPLTTELAALESNRKAMNRNWSNQKAKSENIPIGL